MIVVVTGMVGVDKKVYLEQVCELARQRGRDVELCNVGDMMYAEAPDIPPGKILDISMKRLSSLRRSVFKDIIARAQRAENMIVNTHATFRWRHGLFPAVDFDQMRQLDADMYINLIDGVIALHSRLTKDHPIEHSLKDLIVWREEEIIGTEMLCRGVSDEGQVYCLARGSERPTTDTFYRLVFEQQMKKAYLSFPMTHVSEMPEVQARINEFRKAMRQRFICFDPGELEESYLPMLAEQAAARGEDTVEFHAHGRAVRLGLLQIQQIKKDIDSQIYARDFMLIDQADMIISFIPALPDGRPAISSGVERELQHAHEGAKEVYVVWQPQQRPSVFITQTATRVFDTAEAAMEFFKEKGYTPE